MSKIDALRNSLSFNTSSIKDGLSKLLPPSILSLKSFKSSANGGTGLLTLRSVIKRASLNSDVPEIYAFKLG